MFSMMPAASPAIRASRMGAAGWVITSQLVCVSKGSCHVTKLGLSRSLHTFVEVPEEEEFAPAGRGGADVTEQIDARVPEHAVEAQHHLQTGRDATFTAVQE